MASTVGIIIWKEGQQAVILPRNNTPFIGHNDVNTFLCRQDGIVWVGTSGGVGLAFTDRQGRMLKMEEDGHDLSNCYVRAFSEDHLHRVWIATDNAGIIRVSGDIRKPQSVRCRQYAPVNGNYPIDDATAVYEDKDHRIWAISGSGGLFLYNPDEDHFEAVNLRFHIGISSVYAIKGDENGRLWLLTDKGLVCLKVNTEGEAIPTYYSMEDGINTVLSPKQPWNESLPMVVTPSGIITSPFTPATKYDPSFEQSNPFIEQ